MNLKVEKSYKFKVEACVSLVKRCCGAKLDVSKLPDCNSAISDGNFRHFKCPCDDMTPLQHGSRNRTLTPTDSRLTEQDTHPSRLMCAKYADEW